jgi:predicted MFS family arabinose efflux permease
MGVAAVFAAVATVHGQSYQKASGVALTLIAIGVAAGFAVFAVGLARAKPWTRTPVVMTQLFVVIAGITLLDGHRPEWGVPALVLAACCLAGLFTPASLRALNRPARS